MSETDNVAPFADYLQDLNSDQQNLAAAVNRLLELKKQGNELKNEFKELYGPEDLFRNTLLELPLLLKDLRDTLRSNGVTIVTHNSGRVIETLCMSLFEGEDRETGMECIADHRKRGRAPNTSRNSSIISPQGHGLNSNNSSKTAHNIAMRFKDTKAKFSGALEENWKHFLTEYLNACEDYDVPNDKKVQYMYHVLKDDARLYYDSHIRNKVSNFAEACSYMNEEYNSIARQNRIRNQLSRLRVAQYITEGTSSSDALEIIHRKITKLYLLGPSAYRTEAHKIDYLRSAVIGMSWARECLNRCQSMNLSYQSLYSQLEAAIQQETDEKQALASDDASLTIAGKESKHSVSLDDVSDQDISKSIPGIMFTGQARYGRNNTHQKTCYNCGIQGHVLRECKKPINVSRLAAQKLHNRNNYSRDTGKQDRYKRILFELSSQLGDMFKDEDGDAQTETTENNDEQAINQQDIDLQLLSEELFVQASNHANTERPDGVLYNDFIETSDARENEILLTGKNNVQQTPISFDGICIDNGAQRSVAGIVQTKAYLNETNQQWNPVRTKNLFKFGETVYESLGQIEIRIPIPMGGIILTKLDVINSDVPILLGLDFLDREGLVPDNVENLLVNKNFGWTLPLVRKRGHLYLEWKYNEILYTKAELQKFHFHFFHPHFRKLFNLILRANPNEATPETKRLLKNIQDACQTCQRFTMKPKSFQVSMPDGIVFNSELSMDLMFINRMPILHVIDTHTNFSSAEILKRQNIEAIWYAFLKCWASTYVGYPNKIRVDAGSVFTSPKWKKITDLTGITLQISGVESHNSIANGERYHAPLRRIYLKIFLEFKHLEKDILLKLAVKAMNDTMGPNGLVPSLLVFGILPRFPAIQNNLPNQKDRMRALEMAKMEMENIVAEQRLKTAITSNIPAAARTSYKIGDQVLIYREKAKPYKWTGPYAISKIEDKSVYINRNGEEVKHSLHQVKHFIKDDPSEELFMTLYDTFHSIFEKDKEKGSEILITKVLAHNDKYNKSTFFDKAKQKEILGLQNRNVWKIVAAKELPINPNVITGRFVCAIKNVGTNEETPKARFVAQGHLDNEKLSLVHNSTTAKHASTRLLCSLSSIYGFEIWSHDVTQAYVQSTSPLSRDVYIKPPQEMKMEEGLYLKLLKPLYGLADAGDYWNATIREHYERDLKLLPTVNDSSLFYKHDENGNLIGLIANYVDDSLIGGTNEFKKITQQTLLKFDSRKPETVPTNFAGVRVNQTTNVNVLSQPIHITKLEILPESCQFNEFRSTRAQLSWISHTRPDIICPVNMAAQVTELAMTYDDIKRLNKVIKHLKQTPDFGLNYPKLDSDSLYLRVYSDSAFANNSDKTSQIGYIILICDKYDRCHVLKYNSKKNRRVTRSILGGETCALAEAFDAAYVIKFDLERIMQRKIPVTMFTDSKSLFDVIIKSSDTIEKRLQIDLATVREGYHNQEISNLAFIRSEFNPADALTKMTANAILQQVLSQNIITHPVEQWIIRSE